MPKAAQITVRGKVQGVGFRHFVYNIAKNLSLTGFVRNNPDRSVTICCEGNDVQVKMFIESVKKGSVHSNVEKVSVQYYNSTGKYNEFNITG
ncbi:MAG: acylphosphatase [Candidatus Muirbacterium halophilum]|nr:acylphosphatase [Candidatus Muirbacterium halophilum]MCK9475699.1 acylphosphatase [Candidatus Muirbacterium halophilum]